MTLLSLRGREKREGEGFILKKKAKQPSRVEVGEERKTGNRLPKREREGERKREKLVNRGVTREEGGTLKSTRH